jgi:hypothetical protein
MYRHLDFFNAKPVTAANTWSDAARQASVEARRGKETMLADDASKKAYTATGVAAKSGSEQDHYAAEKEHANAITAHESAQKLHSKLAQENARNDEQFGYHLNMAMHHKAEGEKHRQMFTDHSLKHNLAK